MDYAYKLYLFTYLFIHVVKATSCDGLRISPQSTSWSHSPGLEYCGGALMDTLMHEKTSYFYVSFLRPSVNKQKRLPGVLRQSKVNECRRSVDCGWVRAEVQEVSGPVLRLLAEWLSVWAVWCTEWLPAHAAADTGSSLFTARHHFPVMWCKM